MSPCPEPVLRLDPGNTRTDPKKQTLKVDLEGFVTGVPYACCMYPTGNPRPSSEVHSEEQLLPSGSQPKCVLSWVGMGR